MQPPVMALVSMRPTSCLDTAPPAAFATRITGEVPPRPHDRHDFFNALAVRLAAHEGDLQCAASRTDLGPPLSGSFRSSSMSGRAHAVRRVRHRDRVARSLGFQHTPLDLAAFEGFEQGLEVVLAEAFVALAVG